MGQTLSNNGIQQGEIINAQHVSQSVDALTGVTDYDITVKGTIAVKSSNGGQTFKFDGNNFTESESNTFLVRNNDGTVGFRTGGATGAQGPQGNVGPQGPQGDIGPQGTGGTSGTSGTSGENGEGSGIVTPPISGTNGTSGTSGVRGANGGFFSCLFDGVGGGAPSNGRFKVDAWGTPSKIFVDYSVSGDDTASTVNNIYSTLNTLAGPHQNTYIRLLGKNDPTKFLYANITNVIDRGGYFEFQLQNTQNSGVPNVNDDIFTFDISGTGGDDGPQGTGGTSGTSGVNGSLEMLDTDVNFTIDKNLDGKYQCAVPGNNPIDLINGDVGFIASNDDDGSANANDVTTFYIKKRDKTNQERTGILTERLRHFDASRLELEDQGGGSNSTFKWINLVNYDPFYDGYIELVGVTKTAGGGTFNDNSSLEKFRLTNGVFVYELKPNHYERVYLNSNGNDYDDSIFCLVGLKEGVEGYIRDGEFKPGQKTVVEVKSGGRKTRIHYLRGTGPGYMPNSTNDPYATEFPERVDLGSLDSGKRAIVEFVYYESRDGSRYGLIPSAVAMNLS